VETDWIAAGAGAWAAVGAADVVDDGVCSNAAPAGMPPEGGGTGANKLFPDLEVVDAAGFVILAGATLGAAVIAGFSAGVVDEGMVVTVAGWLVGSCTVAPEGVTITGGGAVGGAVTAVGWVGFSGITGAAACGFSAGGATGGAVTASGWAGFSGIAGAVVACGFSAGGAIKGAVAIGAGWAGFSGIAGAAAACGFSVGGAVGDTVVTGAGWAGFFGIFGAGVCAFVGAGCVSNSRSFSSSAARAAA
jgi:hypothetical protein